MDIDRTLFSYDMAQPLDLQDVGQPQRRDDVMIRDITFAVPDGRRVSAYLVEPPAEPSKPRPAVLWVHWLEPEAHNSNRTQFLDEAVALAQDGVVSLLPDGFWTMTPKKWAENPGFGWRSDFTHDRALCIRQTIELRRALDLLTMRDDVDRERIAFVGHDFGAMYGALVMGVEHRIQAAVLMAGTVTFSEWFLFGSTLTPEQEKQYIQDMAIFDPARYVAHAAPARLLFQFAHADYYVPERTGQMFFDAASQPKDIKWYEAQHDLVDPAEQSTRDRTAWLRGVLGLS